MKFVVEKATLTSGRLGHALIPFGSHEHKVRTPMLLLTTQTGCVPHLTKDALELVLDHSQHHKNKNKEQQQTTASSTNVPTDTPDAGASHSVLSVPVVHFMSSHETLEAYGQGVASFAGLPKYSVLATAQCSLSTVRSGYNTSQGISVWSHNGRKILTPKDYMRRAGALRAVWCEALHDADTPRGCASKRLAKSLAASHASLTACLDLLPSTQGCEGLLVPLLGGWEPAQRSRWTTRVAALTSQEGVGGYSLSGLHLHGAEAEALRPDPLLLQCVHASLSETDARLPRFALGSYGPLTALTLVGAGVDVLDSSLAARAANRHCALVFSYSDSMLRLRLEEMDAEATSSPHDSSAPTDAAVASSPQLRKRKKFRGDSEDFGEVVDDPSDCGPVAERPYEINLSLDRYGGSSAPLLRGCGCYACSSGYTRGYVQHLCSTGEMLAPVLLHMHNLHHLLGYMVAIRAAVAADTVADLRDVVVRSYRPSVSGTDAGQDSNAH